MKAGSENGPRSKSRNSRSRSRCGQNFSSLGKEINIFNLNPVKSSKQKTSLVKSMSLNYKLSWYRQRGQSLASALLFFQRNENLNDKAPCFSCFFWPFCFQCQHTMFFFKLISGRSKDTASSCLPCYLPPQ